MESLKVDPFIHSHFSFDKGAMEFNGSSSHANKTRVNESSIKEKPENPQKWQPFPANMAPELCEPVTHPPEKSPNHIRP